MDSESRLTRHQFDFGDLEKHFSRQIQSTLSTDAAVLYGVLAVSARHLEQQKKIDEVLSCEYERCCLQILIPSLSKKTETLQDGALASAMLLRLLDEMTGQSSDASSRLPNLTISDATTP